MVAAGMWGVTMLRPHVAITMFFGIALAGLVGKLRGDVAKSSLLRIVLFGVLLAVGGYLATSTAEFFGVPALNKETINQQLADAEGRTQDAGSVFTPYNMSNPANTPLAFVTVIYRPFPIEASSVVALVSSMEGVFLLVLTWRSRSRLRSLFRSMRREPYVAYCVGVHVHARLRVLGVLELRDPVAPAHAGAPVLPRAPVPAGRGGARA